MASAPSRLEAIRLAHDVLEQNPVFVDTETTGISASDQVVEICVLDQDGQVLLDTLVRPQGRIPRESTRIHNITDEMVRLAPSWAELWPQLEPILAERRIAIFNAEFDMHMMQQSHRRHGLAWKMQAQQFTCIMKLYAQYAGLWDARRGSYRWHSLENAGRQCRITKPKAHRAKADAELAYELLRYMAAQ